MENYFDTVRAKKSDHAHLFHSAHICNGFIIVNFIQTVSIVHDDIWTFSTKFQSCTFDVGGPRSLQNDLSHLRVIILHILYQYSKQERHSFKIIITYIYWKNLPKCTKSRVLKKHLCLKTLRSICYIKRYSLKLSQTLCIKDCSYIFTPDIRTKC